MAETSGNKLFGTVAVGVVGIIGVALIIKLIRDSRKMGSGKRVVEDENVRIAMELNSAIHPGRSFISDIFVSANKDEIFRLGGHIDNFDDIATEYKNLYKASLSHELQDALGNDYPDFINKLKRVQTGTDMLTDIEAGELVNRLFDEMDGINWFGRDTKPFTDLLRLSDKNFKKVIEIYNSKHREDFKTMFDNEFSASVIGTLALLPQPLYSWPEIVEKINKRYSILF